MAAPKRILIADPDPATARALGPALRRRGWQVQAARDGSRALQLAILRFPDLVLFDERCPLVDARTFARILRTNPRTERIPVVFLGEKFDPDRARLGSFLHKPLREEEVLARVDQLLRRAETARAVSGESELAGNLARLPLADLLQVLGMNRRSGRLELDRNGERAEIVLRDGRVVDASVGPVAGEKALYRLLGRREGQFAFAPDRRPVQARIGDRRLDELLLEGLRQADESAALLPGLPAPAELVELVKPPGALPPGLHPVTAEVVALLARPLPLAEILDRTRATDLEVLRALAALLDRGWARRREAPPAAAPSEPLLGPAELHQLRVRVARGKASGERAAGKVVLLGGGPLARRAALARIGTVAGFDGEPEPAPLGAVGRLDLGDGLRVDLCGLPLEPELLPAFRAFASGALGALVLLPAEGFSEAHAALLRDLRVPAVVCGPSLGAAPEQLRDGPSPAAFGGADAAEALRALLAGAGRPPASPIAPP